MTSSVAVAEEPLGPEVPADQPPDGIGQEEGVLRRVGREQVEPLGQRVGRQVNHLIQIHSSSSTHPQSGSR